MKEIKLDKKDMRILDELDKKPNLNINKLAKNIGVSRQVADYRLNKLLSQNTIRWIHPLIDVSKLGYILFSTHIKLKPITKKTSLQFSKRLSLDYPTAYISFVTGSFDLIFDVYAKNLNDFKNLFSEISKKYKNIIYSYEVFIVSKLNIYQYRSFIGRDNNRKLLKIDEPVEEISLDDKDIKILHSIKFNSRTPYEVTGKEVGLTRNAVKDRIKKLEEKGVISGYSIFVNVCHLGKQIFRIFIKYHNHKQNQEESLMQYLKQTPGIIQTIQLFGKWNLDIEIHKKDVIELQEFIIELRNKYDLIEEYEVASIISPEFKVEFFPEKLYIKN